MYQQTNDTINSKFSTKTPEDYSSLKVKITNVEKYPLIVQLLNSSNDVVEQQVFTQEHEKGLIFKYILPSKYSLRVIYDDNRNGKWDTGNYLKNIQPEKIVYFPDKIELKANWEIVQEVDMKNNDIYSSSKKN